MSLDSSERCATCQALDFHSIFRKTEIPPTGLEVAVIGKLSKNPQTTRPLKRSSCEVCDFFRALAPAYRRRHGLHVRLFNHISRPSWRNDGGTRTTKVPKTPFLSVLRKNSRLRYDDDIMDEVVQNGLAVFVTEHARDDDSVHRVNSSVRFDLIKAQLRECVEMHKACGRRTGVPPDLTHIRLIDCETRTLVERSIEEQYLTLSYVWGKQIPGTNTSASQFGDAPLTVRDAISATRRLGYQYLWVDRSCIDQNDTSARANMIANMDEIYEHSVATIVALHGDNDQAGLPGVSTSPRVPQMHVECDCGFLVSSCPPVATAIERSTWSTRGWTYQEGRLSRRCLFFSSVQVYLVCQKFTRSEAVPHPPSSSSIAALLNAARLDGDLFGRKSISHAISRDRLMYTKRNLTFSHDALNAFRGILRRSDYVTLWGVPVMLKGSDLNPHHCFALGHLWIKRPTWMRSAHLVEPTTGFARRPGFPTWSWTSLATEIHQDGHGPQSLYGQYLQARAVKLPHNEAEIEFAVEIGVGQYESLTHVALRSQSALLPETSLALLVRGQIASLRRKRRDEHTWYKVDDTWIYFRPDLLSEEARLRPPGQPNPDDREDIADDALVLVQWHDDQKSDKIRFVLMILEWVDDMRAERKGLLTEYRSVFDATWVRSLHRTYRKFILQ